MTTKESGVYDLRCLFIPVLLSEIDVPKCSWRFAVLVLLKGKKRCRLKPSSAARLSSGQAGTTFVPRFKKTRVVFEGKVCRLAGAALRVLALTRETARQPVLRALLGASPGQRTFPRHGTCERKAQYSPTAKNGECGDRMKYKTSKHSVSAGCFPLDILDLVCLP